MNVAVWYDRPVFYEATPIDIAVLLVIGIAWSATVWFVTESTKTRLRLSKPYDQITRIALAWLPVICSSALAIVAFPVALHGVGVASEESTPFALFSALVGAVGGFGSKIAHDYARRLMLATLGRLISLIGGSK